MTKSERRRFPPPWTIEELRESFIIHDASGQPVVYVYFDDEPRRQMSPGALSYFQSPVTTTTHGRCGDTHTAR